jgi:hypothetical protein
MTGATNVLEEETWRSGEPLKKCWQLFICSHRQYKIGRGRERE